MLCQVPAAGLGKKQVVVYQLTPGCLRTIRYEYRSSRGERRQWQRYKIITVMFAHLEQLLYERASLQRYCWCSEPALSYCMRLLRSLAALSRVAGNTW